MTTTSISDWINQSIARLKPNSDFPSIETYAIASFVLGQPKEQFISHPETLIEPEQQARLDNLIQRLINGEPLAYLTGKRSFFGLDFEVTPQVLIPRPETEILIEEAIHWLECHPEQHIAADIGTGSGAIAIVLADHFPDLKLTAIDVSPEALVVARSNAGRHHVQDQITFIQNDLLDKITERFDLILANLPYIPTADLAELEVSRYEPAGALDGGKDGMVYINKLLQQVENNLNPGGSIMLEIQHDQSQHCSDFSIKIFPDAHISILSDLNSLPRVVKIQL